MDIEVMAVFMTGRDNKLLILIRLLTSVEHTIYRCICVSFINPRLLIVLTMTINGVIWFKWVSKVISADEDQKFGVRTSLGDTEWFQVEKGVRQGCILSPNLFDIYSEDIMA